MNTSTNTEFEVAIIGGGAAGLSAAVTLGRARRSVVVIDSGAPRNAPSEGIHMFLTRDEMKPADFVRIGREEVRRYGGLILDAEAISAVKTDSGFTVTLADGSTITSKRLLVTTGLVDELPDVPGLRELWGKDVHHCPFCHGWELKGQKVGVLASGIGAVHKSLMFRQLVSDLTLFLNGGPDLTAEEAEQLAARGIAVVPDKVDALDIMGGRLAGVQLVGGAEVKVDAIAVNSKMVARSQVLTSLGLEVTQNPMGFGEFIQGDTTGLTSIPGVWVAGNVADLTNGVVNAAAAGSLAAVAINMDLIAADTAEAVAAYRDSLVSAS